MTDREKAIVMAYTGVAMLTGDKLDIFYKYLAELFDRPVFSHELATQEMTDKIKEKSKPDFIKLCRETTEPIRHAQYNKYDCCTVCGSGIPTDYKLDYIERSEVQYCYYCGAKMDEVIDNG